MKVYTFTQAREHLAAVLEEAREQEVIIRRRNGDQFSIVLRQQHGTSPFDVASVNTKATTQDILDAIRESRERG
ncbi:MAG TPA: prevent-host-death protein [Thermoanaerobaculia bacterium]|nr:prevent-host-death protein [Thermoanaerobaculia bacterium]